ncbi:hypothetical protein ACFL0Q_02455, partial [Thermodesulfobacteriota bacterium]
MEEAIGYEVSFHRSEDGFIGWLSFSSESKLNVLTLGMVQEIRNHVTALAGGEWPRVLVIGGRGDMFTGGLDLKSLAG